MTDRPAASAARILAEVGIELAIKDGDPADLLGALRMALRLDPENARVQAAIDRLAAELADSPAVVLIERVRVAGRAVFQPEGNVYIEEPDGRLRRANGQDIADANERFPHLLRNWRLDED